MRDFEFQIRGLTRAELRRHRDEQQSHHSDWARAKPIRIWRALSPAARGLIWAGLIVVGLYGVNWTFTMAENYPADVYRRLISRAGKVIILPDDSGSMKDDKLRLEALIDQLRRNQVDVSNRYVTQGGGFSSRGPENNSLKVLEKALNDHPDADAVFVFSDFLGGVSAELHPDNHDEAGLEQLRQLIRGRRLFLGTVDKDPPPELLRIARESGGGLFQVVQ